MPRITWAAEQNFKRLVAFMHLPDVARRRIVLVGNADSTGNRQQNLALSERRASELAKKLLAHGVENPIERSLGMGSEYLVADDHGDPSSAGARRNRRVDVYLQR